ncbi:MAG TPA: isoleucine--tRNA ligase [Candidatus Pacearchaeota archaeon]|nr:isoleucine--tRNA ligase [Candidatus Pacearchaeota archaeon]HOL90206.1 isoleucine--tRNA ligase [Candidatus Pacearchaeota archaeon]HPO68306.1 isoleucine--tRNA ligase [Candidatus Pacearchaeota archaeon]
MAIDILKTEEKILKFWKKNKIFEKSLKKREKNPNFVFFEGPPTANGRPGIHHVLTRVFKDIVCRYKTMRGYKVIRKAGWDTHGLPVELEIEKKLNFSSKNDIEKYGIEKFNKKCKESVWEYKKEWEKLTERIGFWIDMKNPYITYENNYIESVWWILKQIWQKGLIYKDYKVVYYCPRCETTLSSHELSQGYKRVKENSIYVKFPIKNSENRYFLVWTTTPWTLPANVALAINKDISYVEIKKDEEKYILAKNRLSLFENEKIEIIEEFNGNELINKNLEYIPLFDFVKPIKRAYFLILADFVSDKEGTGIVHIAPAFGEDDMEAGKKNNLDVFQTVNYQGKFKDEISLWKGIFVKDADPLIINNLKERNLLFKEEIYEHDYPFCWRCKFPLLYYAKESWFINMNEVKNDLLKNNQKINWVPDYLKEGRFGEWLKEVKDWAISRERYWGTPLPIWECEKCKEKTCIGSIKELLEKSEKKIKIKDLHKPFIDKITLKCEKCNGKMKRVPEVLDCWFDSGSMPFAQYHYPFENKDKIDKKEQFPADFICEGIDQTRGWFYTLLAVSTLLNFGNPYKNVISLGHILDENGEKMSKSKGNVVNPWEMINKYGIEAVRWYFYTINQPGEPKLFKEKDVLNALNRFILILLNCFIFLETYKKDVRTKIESKDLLDKWIISRLNQLIIRVSFYLDKYDITSASRDIENFVVNDLSQWYIRVSRPRFQKPENKKDLINASSTLNFVLLNLSKLLAPFIPFLSEEIYLNLNKKGKSVHLEDWPIADKRKINKKIEEKMEEARKIVSLSLSLRSEAKIKVRQPLKELKIKNTKLKKEKELLEIIKNEINVKNISFDEKMEKEIDLNCEITEELRKEGDLRELIRNIKDLRKKLNLKPQDFVKAFISNIDILPLDEKDLLKETKAKKYFKVENESEMKVDAKKEIEIGGKKYLIGIKK